MSDVAGADTPQAPVPGVQHTDESAAIASISEFLHREEVAPDTQEPEAPTPDDTPADGADDQSRTQSAEDQQAEVSSDDTSSEESDSGEAEVESLEELPNTLSAFAEAVGIEPDELAGHLLVPVGKDESGNVVEVTLAEAMRGNMRQADYSQKTNELATARREFDAGVEAARKEWQARFETVDSLVAALEAQADPGMSDVELNQLLLDDPQQYLIVKQQNEIKQKAIADAKAQRDGLLEQQKADADKQRAQFRQQEQEALARLMPELRDDKKLTEFEAGLNTFLQSVGFSQEEVSAYIGGVFDHRVIRMADMARKYEAMQKGRKQTAKKLKGLPRVVKPGQARDPKVARTDAASARRNRMVRTGSDDDAYEFVKGLIR